LTSASKGEANITDTAFDNCASTGAAANPNWPQGGAVGVDGKTDDAARLRMERCCGRDGYAVDGQFMIVRHAVAIIRGLTCFGCGLASTDADSGAIHFAEQASCELESCNLTSCRADSIEHGAAIRFYDAGRAEDLQDLQFLTIVNCSGNSIAGHTIANTGRHMQYDSCNFVGNRGKLFAAQGGLTEVVNCHFVGNLRSTGEAATASDLTDGLEGTATMSIISSFFDFAPPTAGGVVVTIEGNETDTFTTIAIVHVNIETCLNVNIPTTHFSPSRQFSKTSSLQETAKHHSYHIFPPSVIRLASNALPPSRLPGSRKPDFSSHFTGSATAFPVSAAWSDSDCGRGTLSVISYRVGGSALCLPTIVLRASHLPPLSDGFTGSRSISKTSSLSRHQRMPLQSPMAFRNRSRIRRHFNV
jgi:hypothetical protein